MKTIFNFFFHCVPFSEYKTAFIIQHSSPLASLICFSEAITFSPVMSTGNSSGFVFFFKYRREPCKIIYGVCNFFFKANSFLPPRRKGWRSHICLPLFFLHFVVELSFSNMWGEPLCSIRRLLCRRCRSGTAINHNTEKQKFICIQLPSTLEAADLELNFFFLCLLSSPPLPVSTLLSAPSSPVERGYDLRGSQISTLRVFLFFLSFPTESLIQLESVQAQWILA